MAFTPPPPLSANLTTAHEPSPSHGARSTAAFVDHRRFGRRHVRTHSRRCIPSATSIGFSQPVLVARVHSPPPSTLQPRTRQTGPLSPFYQPYRPPSPPSGTPASLTTAKTFLPHRVAASDKGDGYINSTLEACSSRCASCEALCAEPLGAAHWTSRHSQDAQQGSSPVDYPSTTLRLALSTAAPPKRSSPSDGNG